MPSPSTLIPWLALWALAMAAIQLSRWRRGGVGAGLVVAYVLNLWLIHWPAAAVYALPWYAKPDEQIVAAGFEQSAYAVVAFGVGSTLLAGWLARIFGRPKQRPVGQVSLARAATTYALAGVVCYLLPLPVASLVPSASALVSAGRNLVVVALALLAWDGLRRGSRRRLVGVVAAAACLPLVSLVNQGFLTYGTAATVALFAFLATFYRPRWRLVAVGLGLAYLGLSLYVTYLRDRVAIRESVWGGQRLEARLERVSATLGGLEWFDPTDDAHLRRVDDRLNQNRLLGTAEEYLQLKLVDYARGGTLGQALIALIPRAIWPSKPVVAGSGGLVSQYTGILFAEGTSVGIGNVMEFYVNFGTTGVVIGSLALGTAIGAIDRAAARRLRQEAWSGFAAWFLPGLALLQVGGSLVEAASSFGSAVVAVYLVNRLITRSGPAAPESPAPRPRVAISARFPPREPRPLA